MYLVHFFEAVLCPQGDKKGNAEKVKDARPAIRHLPTPAATFLPDFLGKQIPV